MNQDYVLFLENFKEKFGGNKNRIMFLGKFMLGLIKISLMINLEKKKKLIIILVSLLKMIIYGIYDF